MGDDLADHGIVEHRNLIALIDTHVGTDILALRRTQTREPARRREEALCRVFRIEAHFDGMTDERDIFLRQRQGLARRHAQLPFDKIGIRDRFRHRMLDLQTRVHFHEPEGVGLKPLRGIGNEFDRARSAIADGLGGCHRRLAHGLAHLGRHVGRRRFLDYLLVATLQRAVALIEIDRIAMRIGKDLNFDMARTRNIFLDQHAFVTKGGPRLALRRCQRLGELGRIINATHALAAATGDRLDENRIADLVGFGSKERSILIIPVITGNDRHASLLHQLLGGILEPHRLDGGSRRADEDNPRFLASLGKGDIFRQEAIARMDRFRACGFGGGDDLVDDEIAFLRRRRTDMHGVIRLAHMQRIGVGIGIDSDGANAHIARRAHDPDGNFAAIGDEKRFEHCFSPHMRNTPNCVSGTGRLRVAEKASASTRRVSEGVMMPSSQSRAVAK